ncbi:c-type cytochrome biogenesis protein CcmI [Alteromonas sp. CYL-A6]|uniref:c-type cytochrome biogenesis protein CcmI n=1 Tax=Alteromonas nitratireducens TaxID=3390813 RepID=UPI0034B2044D
MTWSVFYMVVAAFITLIAVLVVLPWLRQRQYAREDYLSNTQIVRQRLGELEREYQEGLISAEDKVQAETELKLSLVDETRDQKAARKGAWLPIVCGGVLALVAGIWVYSDVNHIPQLSQASDAIDQLPALSDKLAKGQTDSLTQQDIVNLALAIRQRLRQTPDDDRGWMYYGRLMMSLGQDEQALAAVERAVSISPQKTENRITLAQILMAVGDEGSLQRAQSQLASLTEAQPDNDNLALMMAVVSAQLGDVATTRQFFSQVRDKLPPDSDILRSLTARLSELEGEHSGPARNAVSDLKTGFTVTVSVTDELAAEIPDSGFLIVFAQDAVSDNRMPAAVVKIPLPSLPVTISLSTDNAMMPQYSLDNLEKVRISARISMDGNVAPAPGELEGNVIESVSPGTMTSSTIIINKEL